MENIAELLAALADAARNDRKSEFDRLERELLTHFAGSFDSMPADVYAQYLEVDRLWPVVVPGTEGSGAASTGSRGHAVSVRLSARHEAWLRQLGATHDRSLSAVLAVCLDRIRSDEALASDVARQLAHPASDAGEPEAESN